MQDPNETHNLAQEQPEMLATLRQRYLELKATGIDQRGPLSRMAANTVRLSGNFVNMLVKNKGFVGPWCTDGACKAEVVPPRDLHSDESELHSTPPPILGADRIKLPYGLGGDFEGMPPFRLYKDSLDQ